MVTRPDGRGRPRGVIPIFSGGSTAAIELFSEGGGEPVEVGEPGDNESRILAILNGREPHFGYSTPADPVTTRDVTVTSASQFNSEASTGAAIIRINSSFTGNITLRSDCDVIMSNSATITGNLTLGSSGNRCSRARWTGGNISGRLVGDNFQDVLFDDFYLNSGANFSDLTAAAQRFDRVAFLNTTIENNWPDQHHSGGWALFILQRPEDPHQGLIFGNFKVISNGLHAFRVQSTDDLMIVDSALNPTYGSQSGFRIHLNSRDVWVKDTWVAGRVHLNEVSANDGYPQVVNGRFDNMDVYDLGNLGPNYVLWESLSSGVILNGQLHVATGAGDGTFSYGPYTNGGGNSRVAWDGVTLPDHSGIGAIR